MKIFITRRSALRTGFIFLASLTLAACQTPSHTENFSFAVAGDMRQFVTSTNKSERYFDGTCDAMKRVGAGEFLITPGDFDPPAPVRTMLDQHFGKNFPWYPVVGNHEVETPANMAWVEKWAAHIPNLVRRGPPGAELSTYSFDFGNAHFVAVNDYFDDYVIAKSKGSVGKTTLDWMEHDLASTKKPLIFVIGHQPFESLPDMDTGRLRHGGESVSAQSAAKEKFLSLMQRYKVRAYICGHTHNASVQKVKGIWQTDSGHARGAGDIGSPSTFLKYRISGNRVSVDVYRSDSKGIEYSLRKTFELD
jgi:predicted phosphodiesterase